MKVKLYNRQPFTNPAETKTLDITPMTLVTGDNNSGKSLLIKSIVQSLDYRVYNSRVIDPTGDNRLWEKSTAYYIQNLKSPMSIPIPVWDEEQSNYTFVKPANAESNFYQILQHWFVYFGLGRISLMDRDYYKVMQIDGVDIRDLGRGYNHLIAIVIQVLSALLCKASILCVINPETFLCPELQAKLTDFLIQITTQNSCYVLIETHSDHIINRTVLRCVQDTTIIGKTSILYLSTPVNSLVPIHNINIDSHIGIKDAPENFFTLYGKDLAEILHCGYCNMLKDNK